MKSFVYKIKDEIGIHARPAGLLVNEAKKFESTITISKGDKNAVATKLMAIMSMGVKNGDTITITVDGSDEDKALTEMEKFFSENL